MIEISNGFISDHPVFTFSNIPMAYAAKLMRTPKNTESWNNGTEAPSMAIEDKKSDIISSPPFPF